ncbi:MAG: 3-hydroxyacyl-CoA dehydrogenase NAD-binding domain-containing protein [Pseudomonadota bacterium]
MVDKPDTDTTNTDADDDLSMIEKATAKAAAMGTDSAATQVTESSPASEVETAAEAETVEVPAVESEIAAAADNAATAPADADSDTATDEAAAEAPAHWSIETDSDNIAWLTIDKADASTNVLSSDVMIQLNDRIAELELSRPRAVVVQSAKSTGFIAGADITEFSSLGEPDEAYGLIRNGQMVMDRLEALPCPTIALINGFALGGGLELAMACRYRIVVEDDSARLGLPEVMLGIHPGFGGTVRSTRLVGPLPAMDMMLTGRGLRPKQARKIGLVDQVVPARHLTRAARLMALKPPKATQPPALQRLLSSSFARGLIAGQMEKKVKKKARKEHYPAPYAIIDLWRKYADDPGLMYEKEARSIAELMCTPTSRNLVRVFGLQNRMKGMGRKSGFKVNNVHVVGAGVMGGDIAAWCALRGLNVTLQDREPKYLGPAIARAEKLYAKKLRDPRKIRDAMDRLMPDVNGDGVRSADVVIEAIFENAEAKQELFKTLEPQMKPGAVLATNTSSIKLEELAPVLSDPSRLIGLHFFNPVAMMQLVEIIGTPDTNPEELEKGMTFARRIGRLPLPCGSAPGFLVNRVLMPYMMEAMAIGEEGVPLPAIDAAAVKFGMPMGPVELADTVGLDVAHSVSKVFERELGMTVPARLATMVASKKLGRKSGQGFYNWKDGKPQKKADKDYRPPEDLGDRLILPLVNECAALLREGVVDDADLVDAGVIFGTGFAPFHGGPMQYARSRGIDEVVAALSALQERYGDRFAPDEGWQGLADAGEQDA